MKRQRYICRACGVPNDALAGVDAEDPDCSWCGSKIDRAFLDSRRHRWQAVSAVVFAAPVATVCGIGMLMLSKSFTIALFLYAVAAVAGVLLVVSTGERAWGRPPVKSIVVVIVLLIGALIATSATLFWLAIGGMH